MIGSRKAGKDNPSKCPKCRSKERCKNGFNDGRQRYRCKKCSFNYTVSYRGYDLATKLEVIELYQERKQVITSNDIWEYDSDGSKKEAATSSSEKLTKRDRKREFLSLRFIGESLNISDATVLKWGQEADKKT